MVTVDDILSGNTAAAPTSASVEQQQVQTANTTSATQQPAAENGESGASPAQSETSGNVVPAQRTMTYTDMLNKLLPRHELSEAQKKAFAKKKKRDTIFSALGDGISAFANLYFTTKGAPNVYDPSDNLSDKNRERWEKMEKERKEDKQSYLNAYLRAMQADGKQNTADREWKRKIGLDNANEKRAQAKEDRDSEMHEIDKKLKNEQITKAEYEAGMAGIKAKYAEEYQKSTIAKNNRANRGDGSSKYYGRFRDKDYKTAADYERAVMDAVNKYGDIDVDKVLETDYWGNAKRTRRKSIAELAAEVEERDKKGLGWGDEDEDKDKDNETDW